MCVMCAWRLAKLITAEAIQPFFKNSRFLVYSCTFDYAESLAVYCGYANLEILNQPDMMRFNLHRIQPC